MIKIDEALKRIFFQNDFEIGKESAKTYECELLSAYICPKCKQILLAYFKTDEYIRVWEYDEKERERSYNSESDLRYYRYRVFYAGCGIMGMELKEHNGYNGCSFEISQAYNIISSINTIFSKIEEELNNEAEGKKVIIKRLPKDFNKIKLIENLKGIKEITLVFDACKLMDPLVRLEPVKYKEVDIYDYEYDSKERKRAEMKNYESMKRAYSDVIKRIKQ